MNSIVIFFLINSLLIVLFLCRLAKASSYHHNKETLMLPYDQMLTQPGPFLNPDPTFMPLIAQPYDRVPLRIYGNTKIPFLTQSQSIENPFIFIKSTADLSTLANVINQIEEKDPNNLQSTQLFSDLKVKDDEKIKVQGKQPKGRSFFGLPVDGIIKNDNFDKEKTIDEIRAEAMNPLIKINLLIRHSVGQLKKLEAAFAKQSIANQVLTKFILRALLHALKR